MRRFGFVVVLTIAFVAGMAGPAFAQGGGPGGPGRGGPGLRQPDACATVAKAVHDACPCNGTDGSGWTDHAAYMSCVQAAAAAAVAAGGTQECADKVIERADKSPIGTAGFTCPTPGERPTGERPKPDPNATPGAPRHPGRPGDPGRPGHPGRPGVPGAPQRPSDECLIVVKAVHDACPCNGVDGSGWTDHAAYTECVRNAAAAAVAAGGSQECADKAIERADKSPIGTEGFQCPVEGGRGRRGPGGGQ